MTTRDISTTLTPCWSTTNLFFTFKKKMKRTSFLSPSPTSTDLFSVPAKSFSTSDRVRDGSTLPQVKAYSPTALLVSSIRRARRNAPENICFNIHKTKKIQPKILAESELLSALPAQLRHKIAHFNICNKLNINNISFPNPLLDNPCLSADYQLINAITESYGVFRIDCRHKNGTRLFWGSSDLPK